jgi:hypothetical protein
MTNIRTTRARLFLALALLIIEGIATPAAAGDPDLVYSTVETENFSIHHHQGLEELALRVAAICEEVQIGRASCRERV